MNTKTPQDQICRTILMKKKTMLYFNKTILKLITVVFRPSQLHSIHLKNVHATCFKNFGKLQIYNKVFYKTEKEHKINWNYLRQLFPGDNDEIWFSVMLQRCNTSGVTYFQFLWTPLHRKFLTTLRSYSNFRNSKSICEKTVQVGQEFPSLQQFFTNQKKVDCFSWWLVVFSLLCKFVLKSDRLKQSPGHYLHTMSRMIAGRKNIN